MIIGSKEWLEAIKKPRPPVVREKSTKPPIDLWANFFFNEKLDPKKMNEESIMELLYLCEVLAVKQAPTRHPYKDRIACRRLAVDTALDLGIDLIDFKNKQNGKIMIGRGLLDVWQVAYQERYGSTVGTRGAWEAKRRDIKTKLAKARKPHPKDCRCIICDIPYYGSDGQGGW